MSSTANIQTVTKALIAEGITNSYAISGILAVISKESGFIPQSELSYSNTFNTRIRETFSRTVNLSDPELTALKKDPVKFFNFVYGGRYGNAPDEGYKYRGRGFNQLTFKDNYKTYGTILKLDLVNDPDLVNKAEIAAKVAAAYFKREFAKYPALINERYHAKNINDFHDTTTAVNAFYNANAGFAKDTSKTNTTGKTKALDKVAGIYDITVNYLKTPTGKTTVGTFIGLTALFFL